MTRAVAARVALVAAPALVLVGTLAAASVTAGRMSVGLAALLEHPSWLLLLAVLVAIVVAPRRDAPGEPEAPRVPTGGVVVGISLAVAVPLLLHAAGAWGRMPIPSGDAPHYGIAAESLLDDADLALENNAVPERALTWYPGALAPRSRLIHVPGFAFVLVPFVAVARALSVGGDPSWVVGSPEVFLARCAAALGAAAMAATSFALAVRLGARRRPAIAGALLVGLASPVAVVGVSIYPETLAGAAMAAATWTALSPRPRVASWAATGALAGLLPWLGLKYAPAAVLFPLVGFLRGGKGLDARLRAGLAVAAPLAAAIALLAWLSKLSLGHWNPAVVKGTMTTQALAAPLQSLQTALGYFLDPHEGLLWKAPWVIFAFAAIPGWVRARPREAWVPLLLAVAYLGHYAAYRQWSQAGPPARPTTAVVFVAGVALAHGLSAGVLAHRRRAVAIAAAAALFGVQLIWSEPSLATGLHSWSDAPSPHAYFLWLGSWWPGAPAVAPDFLAREPRVASLVSWTALAALAVVAAARPVRAPPGPRDGIAAALSAGLVGALAVALVAGRAMHAAAALGTAAGG